MIHQISTQWDGFRHYGYQNLNVFYNGATAEDFSGSTKLGMHGMRTRCFLITLDMKLTVISLVQERNRWPWSVA
jgi:hypothetical protein